MFKDGTDADKARRDILATFRESLARLIACTTDDEIYAWPDHGLAVGITEAGQAWACSPERAAPASEVLYVVTNGRGEAARKMRRQDVIAQQVAELREHIARFDVTTDDEAAQ